MFGKKAIIDCYENEDCDRFAFFKGKELVVQGDSLEELEKICDRLAMSGSSATYKFRLYDTPPGEKVKPSTEYVCNYEIKFVDPYNGNGIVGGWGNEFLGRIEKLEKKMGEAPEKEDRIGDALMGWLEEPDKLIQAVGAFRSLMGYGPAQPAAIAGIEQQGTIITPDNEAKVIKLSQALDEIEKHDTNIVHHMQKLAIIAKTKPETFKMLLGMLDNF